MRTAIDDLAEKLVPAARDYIGDPAAWREPSPELSRAMEGDVVPAYFRVMAELATRPRTVELWHHYQRNVYRHEPEFIMEAGMDRLAADDTLPPEERRLIEEVSDFDAWATALAYELTQ